MDNDALTHAFYADIGGFMLRVKEYPVSSDGWIPGSSWPRVEKSATRVENDATENLLIFLPWVVVVIILNVV
jgi:hypothetical protein